MAVASYDAKFSFQQDSLARLGDRAGQGGKLTDEQQQKFNESPAMIAARKTDELAQQYTNERDNQRSITDTFFRAEESDWTASKSYEYKRAVDYYNILGVEEHATLEEVKAAYKKLSLIYHPDKTKGLPKEQQEEYAKVFISVKNAHLVLADKPTRRQYDYDRDHDRAQAEVNGTNVHQEQHIDLTEVLERIKEMQRPPGENIEVPVQCKLEKFFYGGRKEMKRKRTIKDFYQGMVTEMHTYRSIITRGAEEPLITNFKEQGDWHKETKPDTVIMQLSSKPHPTVERKGSDLVSKEEIRLGEEVAHEPRLVADAPGLRGRHVLLWGRNPLFGAAAGAQMELSLKGEGLSPEGALRLRCRLGGEGSGTAPPTLSREAARELLREATQIQADGQELVDRLVVLVERKGCKEPDARAAFAWLSAAMQAIPGEWGLLAKARALLARGEGQRPSLAAFLARHGMAPPGGLDRGGAEAEAEEEGQGPWDAWVAPAGTASARHGAGGLCDAAAVRRRSERQLGAACEVELVPFGNPTNLFTAPICSVAFYTNEAPVQGPAGRLPPRSLFALCLSSQACARKSAASTWDTLRGQLLPLLRSTFFLLLPAARRALPLALGDFAASPAPSASATASERPVPWKRLGDEALGRGDFFEAQCHYGRCLDLLEAGELEGGGDLAAKVHSNRAACLARVGELEASAAEARKALEKKPEWGRAWGRLGSALSGLGGEHAEEAFNACFKAVELEPSASSAEALTAATVAVKTQSLEASQKERDEGNTAYKARRYGTAVARYTVALALVPPHEDEAQAYTRATVFCNRAAALCRLKRWDAAVADGRSAVSAQPAWAKAHIRLGVALLAAGQVEQAYTEFAWALVIDNDSEVARNGQEAALTLLPTWRSVPAKRRWEERFSADLGRPRGATRIFAISDLHYDHKPNEEWTHRLDELEYQEDVLIVAGNVANTHHTATKALRTLKSKFRRVFFVPGNEDLWMNPGEVHNSRFPDSFAKFMSLVETCDELGVDVFPAAVCSDVFVVPIFSWYNAQFDKKSRPDPNYNPDETCVWPVDGREQLWKYMLKLNESLLEKTFKGTVITFSHFLPLATLPFSTDGNMRAAQSMGCEDVEDYIRMARSSMHVYGHSWMQASEDHGGVMFVNRYHGYASENPQEAPPPPLCIFDGSSGGMVVSDSRKGPERQVSGDAEER